MQARVTSRLKRPASIIVRPITRWFLVGKPTVRVPRCFNQLPTKENLGGEDQHEEAHSKAKTAHPFLHHVGLNPHRQRPKFVISTLSKYDECARALVKLHRKLGTVDSFDSDKFR
jgi:hypothetical protein